VKTRGLTKGCMDLLGRHAVIDDKVEADLGQREVKFLSCALDRARNACQVGAQIDDWDDLCVGHFFRFLGACARDRAVKFAPPAQRWRSRSLRAFTTGEPY
jgi:hypothetical protein